MPALLWEEIRQRAIRFSKNWQDETNEQAEAQTFWNELFEVFGTSRRAKAVFEDAVKSVRKTYKHIDLFWKGVLLAEHKSRGQSLDKAKAQAFEYIRDLQADGRSEDVPRFVAVSDFRTIVLYDLEGAQGIDRLEVPLSDFSKHLSSFAFLAGRVVHKVREQDEADLKAAALMARLHNCLRDSGNDGPDLERLLVRLLFCLFADDTGIFEPNLFEEFIENKTNPDGTDLGMHLTRLFKVLDTPIEKRPKTTPDYLNAFEYINGELFTDQLEYAEFDTQTREALLQACDFQWARISPAVFGSLFQGVMDPDERRQIGAHYTSEADILKLIGPLFLDELKKEVEDACADRSTRRKNKLQALQEKIAGLRFLDPACGCGNFLVIAYRELRALELEILKAYWRGKPFDSFTAAGIQDLSKCDVDQFYGIEIDLWPSRIAETALWLTDHQANLKLSEAFGQPFSRIPLRKTPHIHCANAISKDWQDVIPALQCNYILGNPPFSGGKQQSVQQRRDIATLAAGIKCSGLLDYVSLWYIKAAKYMQDTSAKCGFVSTNSISQGEQVGILWPYLEKLGVRIHFAHRTFAWQSEARGKAHVHVVIIGFALYPAKSHNIYEYPDPKGAAQSMPASRINGYLIDFDPVYPPKRSNPIFPIPKAQIGNKPIDGGYYLFSPQEKQDFLRKEPRAAHLFKRWCGSKEFINSIERWCLYLLDANPAEIRALLEVSKRVKLVSDFRKGIIPAIGKPNTTKNRTRDAATRKLGDRPLRYHVEFKPTSSYLVIPETSSERREYVPMSFLKTDTVPSNLVKVVPEATLFHFGILTSQMHMAWMRQVCGRLESRYRYSIGLVYNNFPWPTAISDAARTAVEKTAQAILELQSRHLKDEGASLASLYDPQYMPDDLLAALQANDKAVDFCYTRKKFKFEKERVEFLFDLYAQATNALAPTSKKVKRRKKAD